MKLMDYSLIIGFIEARDDSLYNSSKDSISDYSSIMSSAAQDRDSGIPFAVIHGKGTYYFGIIDILQEWNWSKKIERFFKVYLKREDGNGISAISPLLYAERFMKRAVFDVFDGVDNYNRVYTKNNPSPASFKRLSQDSFKLSLSSRHSNNALTRALI